MQIESQKTTIQEAKDYAKKNVYELNTTYTKYSYRKIILTSYSILACARIILSHILDCYIYEQYTKSRSAIEQ